MILPAAFINAFLFFALAGIHFYWAAGGEWGGDVAVPSTKSGTKLAQNSTGSYFNILRACIREAFNNKLVKENPLLIF